MNLRNYQKAFLITLLSSFTVAGGFVGCSSPDPTNQGGSCSPDIASIRQDIFLKSCAEAGCHGATQPAASLDLTREDIESVLVNAPAALCSGNLVVPGDPAGSVLYQKLGTPSCGLRMPMTGALSDAQIGCIEEWIAGLPGSSSSSGSGGNGGAGGAGGAGGSGGGMACETCGGATCVDLQTDAAHCGNCNTACDANMVCNMGMCAGGCGSLTQCGASCVDLQSDVNHCGMCNMPCAGGTPCTNGQCMCPGTTMLCGGKCVDTASDQNNCGACGKQCAVGQTCTDGKCECGMSSVSFSDTIQPILTSQCATAGCHGGVVPQAGLNLTTGKSYMSLVNVNATQCLDGRKRVMPGDPGASYVVDKMTNVDICFGTQMPKLGLVPQAQVQSVIDWICQGALNN